MRLPAPVTAVRWPLHWNDKLCRQGADGSVVVMCLDMLCSARLPSHGRTLSVTFHVPMVRGERERVGTSRDGSTTAVPHARVEHVYTVSAIPQWCHAAYALCQRGPNHSVAGTAGEDSKSDGAVAYVTCQVPGSCSGSVGWTTRPEETLKFLRLLGPTVSKDEESKETLLPAPTQLAVEFDWLPGCEFYVGAKKGAGVHIDVRWCPCVWLMWDRDP